MTDKNIFVYKFNPSMLTPTPSKKEMCAHYGCHLKYKARKSQLKQNVNHFLFNLFKGLLKTFDMLEMYGTHCLFNPFLILKVSVEILYHGVLSFNSELLFLS